MNRVTASFGLLLGLSLAHDAAAQERCDRECLEALGDRYRAAFRERAPERLPISENVRFTENNVEMRFPDGTWDTVTEELGPALTISDEQTGQLAFTTAIVQNDTPGVLIARLKVENGEITEIEQIISTRRNLSSPPTPIGDPYEYWHDEVLDQVVPVEHRVSRERLLEHGEGYLATLERNTGEIRGTQFTEDAIRNENGMLFENIERDFRSGRYAFNDRVRRAPVLVDEERQISLYRGFIDHKGVLDHYTLTDGTEVRSIFREPHSWALLEMFKVVDDHIVSVEAVFIGSPYYMSTPWNPELDAVRYGETGH